MKIAVKHPDMMGIGIMLKECVGLGLATPPGLSGFQGGRPKPSPVVRLFSFALDKSNVRIQVAVGDEVADCPEAPGETLDIETIERPVEPTIADAGELRAWARTIKSGRRISVAEVDVEQTERLVARGTFTFLHRLID